MGYPTNNMSKNYFYATVTAIYDKRKEIKLKFGNHQRELRVPMERVDGKVDLGDKVKYILSKEHGWWEAKVGRIGKL